MLLVDPRQVEIAVDGGGLMLFGQLDTRADAQLAALFVERLEGACSPLSTSRPTATRRMAEGKTHREAQRCLKRYVARGIYQLIQPQARTPAPSTSHLTIHRGIERFADAKTARLK